MGLKSQTDIQEKWFFRGSRRCKRVACARKSTLKFIVDVLFDDNLNTLVFFFTQDAIVTSTEIGEDMDGIELQQKEYDEFKKDMQVQEERIARLQQLCLQLKEEKSSEHEKVQEILTVRFITFVSRV